MGATPIAPIMHHPRALLAGCTLLLALAAGPPASADRSSGATPQAREAAAKIDASNGTACAILPTGAVRCWGRNDAGQLAQGNTTTIGDTAGESTVGVNLGAGRTATAIAVADFHACAILDTGAVRCWGSSAYGELAQGNTTTIGDDPGETTVPVDLGPGRTASAISAGANHSCAILDTGALRCWGCNASGQLGQGNTNDIGDGPGESTVAVDLGAGRTATAAVGFGSSTCARDADGAMRCWGSNLVGQLGQGNTEPWGDGTGETPAALTPIRLAGPDTDGDGVPDETDACPSVSGGGSSTGCPAPALPPTGSDPPPPTGSDPPPAAPAPGAPAAAELTLSGRTLTFAVKVRPKRGTKGCPRTATVRVTVGRKGKRAGRVAGTLKVGRSAGGCLATGRVRLATAPPRGATVSATVSGRKLATRKLSLRPS